ncbi:restriction endonuclease subunit S [Methanobrevibacter boviskoreani]|uniref:restriction endonuclease subunit S n=1 Tax=Methanobrevibacter boviskoreani TaxID=1348249 RepID=UPI0023A8E416|nr:restriction endonuclease subunit S [Methanobrevibacter boviskoreani]MCI6775420.1 restriction endonuclease subunit S [Methanobrevibacter boviskoreani]
MSDDNNVSVKKQDIHDDNQHVPELRFSEFKNNYISVYLKDISSKVRDKNKNNKIQDVLSNSAKYGIIHQKEFFDRNITNKNNIDGYYIVDKGDFVYNPRISKNAPVGPINQNLTGIKGIVSPLYTVFRINNDINSKYIKYYFLTTKWHKYIKSVANYGARFDRINITQKDLFNLPLKLPSSNEQKKVANFMELIDQKIEYLEKKYRNQIKFSKELRNKFLNKHCFFNDNWVEHDIKEYVVEYKEKVNFNNNLPILSSTLSGIYLQEDYFNKNVNSSDVSNYKIVPKNYFTYRSMSDTGKFKFNIQNIVEKGIISPAYPVFTTKNINDKYVYEFLNYSNSIKRQILKIKEGGTRYALGFSKFKKLKIEVPSFKTQCKITESMNLCYQREENLKKEIKIMKKFKKGLLQKMFI